MWNSINEQLVGPAQLAFLQEIHESDKSIAADAALRYGNADSRRKTLWAKLFMHAIFRAKKMLFPLAKIFQRKIGPIWHIWVTDRRRLRDGSLYKANGSQFEVICLTNKNVKDLVEQSGADFVVLTREPNTLLRSAVQAISVAVVSSDASMWFGDSRDVRGVRVFRPSFSGLLLRQVDFLGPIVVAQSELVKEIAKTEVHPNLWPLALGLTIDPQSIELIPKVLGIGDATISNLKSLELEALALVTNELNRCSIAAQVRPTHFGQRDVCYLLKDAPRVSIVIPTRGTSRGNRSFVVDAVKSILEKSTYSNLEFVIVADEETPQSVVTEIDAIVPHTLRWVRWSSPFNFSSKMNLGVSVATGEYVLFLNDDVEVVAPDWIERMISLLAIDGIGQVGALLFFENQRIQHAGHFHKKGVGHLGIGRALRLNDPGELLALDHKRSGVTAACAAMPRELFHKVGGFSPEFPGNYNDADLSLKVRLVGFDCAVSGHARLYHFESVSRNAKVHKHEVDKLFSRWALLLESDHFSRG